MKNALVLILLVLATAFFPCFGQEKSLEHPIHLKSFLTDRKEAFPIRSISGDSLGLFLIDKNSLHGLLLDKKYKIIKELSFSIPQAGVEQFIIGCVVKGSTFTILFTNQNKKKFASYTVDFNSEKSRHHIMDFRLYEEKYVESFQMNNSFYILSLEPQSSNFKMFEFKDETNYNILHFHFKDFKFRNGSPFFYSVIFGSASSTPFGYQKVFVDSPSGLAGSYHPIKFYTVDDKLVITMDHVLDRTILLTLDPKTEEQSIKTFFQPQTKDPVTSNSVVCNNKLYQAQTTEKECVIKITDLKTEKVLKELFFNNKDSIRFSNTPIINFEPEFRKLTTLHFLKKINNSSIALSVSELDEENLLLSVGHFIGTPTNNSFAGLATAFGGAIGGGLYGALAYNEYNHNYIIFSNTWSNYFQSRLSKETFQHIPGKLKPLEYENIKSFDKKLGRTSAKTVFKINDGYVFGYYDKEVKKYYLLKFEKKQD